MDAERRETDNSEVLPITSLSQEGEVLRGAE